MLVHFCSIYYPYSFISFPFFSYPLIFRNLCWFFGLNYVTQFFVSIDFIMILFMLSFLFRFALSLYFYFSVPFCSSSWQERALLLFLRYASRWGNQTMRGFIKTGVTEPARHCAPHICPCQFIEEHLKCKPQGKLKYLRIGYWCSASEYYDWTSVCFLSSRNFYRHIPIRLKHCADTFRN